MTDVIDNKLSDEQVIKIAKTIAEAAIGSSNAQIRALHHNIRLEDSIEGKRKWMLLFYTQCFQLLAFINMAMNDKRSIADYEIELSKMLKGGE